MPHSTVEFSFEEKVLRFAIELSRRDSEDPSAFLMLINDVGEVASIKFRSQDTADCHLSNREALMADEQEMDRALFFDPFDWPEHAWIAWNDFDRLAMERIIGSTFCEADFVSQSGSSMAYPSTWSCMC